MAAPSKRTLPSIRTRAILRTSAPNSPLHTSTPLHTKPQAKRKYYPGFLGRTASLGDNTFDYEEKYVKDRYGKELGPNARVWRTHSDEFSMHDAEMVEGWKVSTDVLLVFAGLFSAIVTTFCSQTSSSLQPDNTLIIASLLQEQIGLQRAAANGAALDSVPASPLTTDSPFSPLPTDVLVNAFWFTSLMLSLAAALMAVVVKQWIDDYGNIKAKTFREFVRRREFRRQGFERWCVEAIVTWLPLLLHAALVLFIAGLVLFLFPLSTTIASIVATIAGITGITYTVMHVLSIVYPDCPYKTTLSSHIYRPFSILRTIVTYLAIQLRKRIIHTTHPTLIMIEQALRQFQHTISSLFIVQSTYRAFSLSKPDRSALYHTISSLPIARKIYQAYCTSRRTLWALHHVVSSSLSLEENERRHIGNNADEIDAQALVSLYDSASNASVRRVVVQSLAGLRVDFSSKGRKVLEKKFMPGVIREHLLSCFEDLDAPQPSVISPSSKIERLARAYLQFRVQPADKEIMDIFKRTAIQPSKEEHFRRFQAILHAFDAVDDKMSRSDLLDSLLKDEECRLPAIIWTRLLQYTPRHDLSGGERAEEDSNWDHIFLLLKALPRYNPIPSPSSDQSTEVSDIDNEDRVLLPLSRPDPQISRFIVKYLHVLCPSSLFLPATPPAGYVIPPEQIAMYLAGLLRASLSHLLDESNPEADDIWVSESLVEKLDLIMAHLYSFVPSVSPPLYLKVPRIANTVPMTRYVMSHLFGHILCPLRSELLRFLRKVDPKSKTLRNTRISAFRIYAMMCNRSICHPGYREPEHFRLEIRLPPPGVSAGLVLCLLEFLDWKITPPNSDTIPLWGTDGSIYGNALEIMHTLLTDQEKADEVVEMLIVHDGLRRSLKAATPRKHAIVFDKILRSVLPIICSNYNTFHRLLVNGTISDLCKWYTIRTLDDEEAFTGLDIDIPIIEDPAILHVIKQGMISTQNWVIILGEIIGITRDARICGYSYFNRSRYLEGFKLLERMKSMLGLYRYPYVRVDLALHEYISVADLNRFRTQPSWKLGLLMFAPYRIPFDPNSDLASIMAAHSDNPDSRRVLTPVEEV